MVPPIQHVLEWSTVSIATTVFPLALDGMILFYPIKVLFKNACRSQSIQSRHLLCGRSKYFWRRIGPDSLLFQGTTFLVFKRARQRYANLFISCTQGSNYFPHTKEDPSGHQRWWLLTCTFGSDELKTRPPPPPQKECCMFANHHFKNTKLLLVLRIPPLSP